jgi:hypothetical protein
LLCHELLHLFHFLLLLLLGRQLLLRRLFGLLALVAFEFFGLHLERLQPCQLSLLLGLLLLLLECVACCFGGRNLLLLLLLAGLERGLLAFALFGLEGVFIGLHDWLLSAAAASHYY